MYALTGFEETAHSLRKINIYAYHNKRAKKALYGSPDYQTSFQSKGLSVQEKKFNIDFQDGGHLGFPSRMISLLLIYKSPHYF